MYYEKRNKETKIALDLFLEKPMFKVKDPVNVEVNDNAMDILNCSGRDKRKRESEKPKLKREQIMLRSQKLEEFTTVCGSIKEHSDIFTKEELAILVARKSKLFKELFQ